MRTSSNPAFRNLPVNRMGGGYAGFQQPGFGQGYQQPGYGMPGYGGMQTPTGERPMTVDDVVTKTGACIATSLVTGIATAWWASGVVSSGASAGPVFGALIGGVIVGLVLSLIIIFKKLPNPAMILGYSAAEGVALGAFTAVLPATLGVQDKWAPIALDAIIGTAGVFIGMLIVYKTGAVKVTPRLRKAVIGAMIGAGILMLANLIMGLFVGGGLGIRNGSPLAIVVSLVFIAIAAFSLLLDFDMADNMIRAQMPAKWGWYAAFGLMTTIVWLYLEMLRFVAYMFMDR